MEIIYLLIGSNLGNKRLNLEQARDRISRELGPVITASSIYKTAPWGKSDQPDFYNQAVMVNTILTPAKALEKIQSIELTMGRTRHEKWGSRIIDIDILFWGERSINASNLTIPHPEIPNRKFVLITLAEINSNFIHPTLNRSVSELLKSCPDTLVVELATDVTDS